MYESKAVSCCSSSPEQEEEISYVNCEGFLAGTIETAIDQVARVKAELTASDKIGSFKARWGVGRMSYAVAPGLYAVGNPTPESPVLVSANYKLSFDSLRKELGGLDLWILVINTKGINVWCAAGKGTFGTAEILRMVAETKLPALVSHRKLILPQLGAPGVAAHRVKAESGFRVIYGPVRAGDLPAFLKNDCKAEPEMRRTTFTFLNRLVLTPVEIVGLLKPLAGLTLAIFLLSSTALLVGGDQYRLLAVIAQTAQILVPFILAALTGAVLAPALLPYIPGRALAWKGWVLGMVLAVILLVGAYSNTSWLLKSAYLLALPAIASFLSLNFTGSTTYTSLSGVVKEMGVALPVMIISASLGAVALIVSFFI
ncbi:MAG: acetyl-CoA synthase subunit gamma [Firmicutes bacterium]|nr:acetyl-CoA synthase subunit gamma [Bacillota bacterium]